MDALNKQSELENINLTVNTDDIICECRVECGCSEGEARRSVLIGCRMAV